MCFFKWKRLYLLAEERIERQKKHIRRLQKDKIVYDTMITNLNFILNKYKDDNINIYCKNGNLYYIVETWLPSIWEDDYIIELKTYNLKQSSFRPMPIAELSAELKLNHIYKEKITFIESIDTMREPRQGHGSQILKRFIYMAKNANVNIVKGELFNSTSIGLENLKKFYIKNGFEIKGNSFEMVIKEPKIDIL